MLLSKLNRQLRKLSTLYIPSLLPCILEHSCFLSTWGNSEQASPLRKQRSEYFPNFQPVLSSKGNCELLTRDDYLLSWMKSTVGSAYPVEDSSRASSCWGGKILRKLKVFWQLLRAAFKDWQDDDCSRMAAALAYYTVFSLAPLLVIAIAIAGAIFGQAAAQNEIVAQIEGLVGSEGARAIQAAIQNANQPDTSSLASIISIIALLFGASGVFVQLQTSLNEAWEVEAKPGKGMMNFIRKRLLSFSAVLGIGFLLLVSLVVSAVISGLSAYLSQMIPGAEYIWHVLNLIASLIVISFAFALIYKYLPDVIIRWSDVWVGAITTAVLFNIGKFAIGFYLGRGSIGSTYGAAGSLAILLAWVYYSAQILFFGAELTQVYARRFGSRIVPDENSVRIQEKAVREYGENER